jgi:hypothetical protein
MSDVVVDERLRSVLDRMLLHLDPEVHRHADSQMTRTEAS